MLSTALMGALGRGGKRRGGVLLTLSFAMSELGCGFRPDTDAMPEYRGLRGAAAKSDYSAEVVIYGCTSAGVVAAVQSANMGKSVLLVCPEKRLGGMTSGGLSRVDKGRVDVIGGLTRRFFRRVQKYYSRPSAWTAQEADSYARYNPNEFMMFWLEPHVAENIFEDWVKSGNVRVIRDQRLDRARGVEKHGQRISSLRSLEGATFTGKMFIDATYEGDLMAAAGVSYVVGREANATYGETLNGVRNDSGPSAQFQGKVSPYIQAGDPDSGLLPNVSAEGPGKPGSADARTQAYNYRICMTRRPLLRANVPVPKNYDPQNYEILLRELVAGSQFVLRKFDEIPNLKTDTNSSGPFGTDFVGESHAYPEASYEERDRIAARHRDYQQGYFHFLATDDRVPAEVRKEMAEWGLCSDEFRESNNWPEQLYVRESRRMLSDVVMTELHVRGEQEVADGVAMGSYTMDSHNVQRYVTSGAGGVAYVWNEGHFQERIRRPYLVSYRVLVPKRGQAENLLVPVCLSSSHVAYSSLRIEPTLMMLGQAAGTAAAQAIDADVSVQDVNYLALRDRLRKDGQVIASPRARRNPAGQTDDAEPTEAE